MLTAGEIWRAQPSHAMAPHRSLLASEPFSAPFPAAFLRPTDQADRGTPFANQIRQRQHSNTIAGEPYPWTTHIPHHSDYSLSPACCRYCWLAAASPSRTESLCIPPRARSSFAGNLRRERLSAPPSEGQDACCGTQSTCLCPAGRHVRAVDIPTQRRCTRGSVHPDGAMVPTGESPRRSCAGAECAATKVRNTQDVQHRSEDRVGHKPVARSAASLTEIETALRPWRC